MAPEDDPAGGEQGLLEARRKKADSLRERGANPFANDVDVTDRVLIALLRDRYRDVRVDAAEERYDPAGVERISEGGLVHVLGRVTSRRGFGKAAFLKLTDATGEIQLFAKKDIMGEAFASLDELDVADHVEARGTLMVTKTGELTIQLTELRMLSKALRPLPDKWHGMTDVDLRYRQRYVDFASSPAAADILRARTHTVAGLRNFLDTRGFLEVETPTLHTLVGGAAARPFTTEHNAQGLKLFLRIAPELHLKRLLVGGFERVYEIGRCYRNEGISTRHNPEFTMLEFYQAYATYSDLMTLTEELLGHVDAFVRGRMLAEGRGARWQDWLAERPFTFDEPFARVSLADAIARALDRAKLPRSALEGVASTDDERAARIEWGNLKKALSGCASDGERAFVQYEYLAEPFLPEDFRSKDGARSLPVFIVDYPIEVSPLARRKDSDPRLVDRFELFVHGRELCNAFSELNDPDDQASRFRDQVDKKARGADETMDYDADYIRALEHGMPPAAGFGLGVDRLVMALTGAASIRDVLAFPLMRPETST